MVVDNLYGTVLQSTEKQVVNNAHGGFIHLSLCDDISGFSLASAYWASTVFVCVCMLLSPQFRYTHSLDRKPATFYCSTISFQTSYGSPFHCY